MLSFKQFIDEELTADQERFVTSATPDHHRHLDFSNHVFGSKWHVHIPLEHHDDPTVPHPDVAKHLANNGYNILDYKQGMAQEIGGHNRTVRIGHALKKTGASDDLINTFASDRQRQSKNISGYKIIISRHPNDIAAMSTGRGWTSCMSLPHDIEHNDEHDIRDDIKHGTHVAYLVHKHDNNIDNPLARIALKKFTNNHNPTDSILHPEPNTYGTGNDSFAHTVRKWTQQHFAPKEGIIYHKPESVYSEHVGSVVASTTPASLDKLVTHKDAHVRRFVAEHGSDRHHAILMTDNNPVVRMGVARNGSSAIKHRIIDDELAKIPSKQHEGVMGQVAIRGDSSHHDRLLTSDHRWVREMVAIHGNDGHRDKLLNDPHPFVRMSINAFGNTKHHEYLAKHDPDDDVKHRAKWHLKQKISKGLP